MKIVVKNEGSAKLLGINPGCYTDRRLLVLGRMLRYLARRCRQIGTDDEMGMDAWHREAEVRWLYDKRYNELNRMITE